MVPPPDPANRAFAVALLALGVQAASYASVLLAAVVLGDSTGASLGCCSTASDPLLDAFVLVFGPLTVLPVQQPVRFGLRLLWLLSSLIAAALASWAAARTWTTHTLLLGPWVSLAGITLAGLHALPLVDLVFG